MASFRSNLNSVPKVTYGLTALKSFTTCFQNWCHKHFNEHQKFYSGVSKSVKLKRLFTINKSKNIEKVKLISEQQQQGKYPCEKIEIVAKLLSSTLIATATTTTTTTKSISTVTTGQLDIKRELSNDDNMTITETDIFFNIRKEYPELESEIRAILHSRAQEGATIGNIREDYKKMTGLSFPIYDNITEFLLCIPWVSVFCNDRGLRIFNIVPTEKTKHLYDLVVNQKPQAVKSNSQCGSNRNFATAERQRQYEQIPLQNSNKNYNNIYGTNYHQNYNNCNELLKLPRSDGTSSTRSESTESGVEFNCFYEDNYNYLNNRLAGQQILPNNDAEHYNNICQQKEFKVPEPPMKRQHIYPFKQPYISRRLCSSPSGTKSSQYNESLSTIQDSEYEAHLLAFPLLGDDFFLYLARMELKCKFKKFEKVLQSGLCVSGQSIGAAIRRIRQITSGGALMERRIIVNIGSVDIMQGKQLVQIEHDFRELINLMIKKGITPILTTLAPLANYCHVKQVKDRLERFNEFIKKESNNHKLLVIDIYSCLVNQKHQIFFDCFQHEPRSVTGTNEPYVFWNKIGRQRVLQMIESELEY